MRLTVISSDESDYPPGLREISPECLQIPTLQILGNRRILQTQPLALFCSIRCPGDVILKTYDLARALRDAEIPVIGGFHFPMERNAWICFFAAANPS
jgi:hypothetical protein